VPLLYTVNARRGAHLGTAALDARCADLLALVGLAGKAAQKAASAAQKRNAMLVERAANRVPPRDSFEMVVEALAVCQQGRRVYPDDPELLFVEGILRKDDGDLAGAVAALESLNGADAEAARPWLLMARERLAAETENWQRLSAVIGRLLARPEEGR